MEEFNGYKEIVTQFWGFDGRYASQLMYALPDREFLESPVLFLDTDECPEGFIEGSRLLKYMGTDMVRVTIPINGEEIPAVTMTADGGFISLLFLAKHKDKIEAEFPGIAWVKK
jgi:hypothetical protein